MSSSPAAAAELPPPPPPPRNPKRIKMDVLDPGLGTLDEGSPITKIPIISSEAIAEISIPSTTSSAPVSGPSSTASGHSENLDSDDGDFLAHFPKTSKPNDLFAGRPPILNKKGKHVSLQNKAQGLFRAQFRKQSSRFTYQKKKKRKSYLNAIWREQDDQQKIAWIEFAEANLRNKHHGVPLPKNFSAPTISPEVLKMKIPLNGSKSQIILDDEIETSIPVTVKAKVPVQYSSRRNRFQRAADGTPIHPSNKSKQSVEKDIPKPQDEFEVKPDNSMQPFMPILTSKPNALGNLDPSPYVPKLKPNEDETEIAECYEHPYEPEIKAWVPDESQLDPLIHFPAPQPMAMEDTMELTATEEGVMEMLDHLRGSIGGEIAVDLEHHSVRTFMGLTCLIQISTRTRDFIVDGLAMHRQLECLNEVFTNPKIIKVFHGAKSDIQWLQRDFGIYVVGMFDTCIAGESLFGSQLSLKYLLETYVPEAGEVDKTYQIADWRVRPLPDDMIHYARKDTHFLLRLYDNMKNLLKDEGGVEKIQQVFLDSSARCLITYEKPDSKPSPTLIQIANALNHRQRYVFVELFKWRDYIAREEDESTLDYVLSNNSLEWIARTLPSNRFFLTELVESSCNDVISPILVAHMETVLSIISAGRQIPLLEDEAACFKQEEDLNLDFRKLPVIPTVEELFSVDNNPLERNIVVGPYASAGKYLDIQFKLLREDFIRSVKPGLRALKFCESAGNRPGIRVHGNISFLGFGAGNINKKNRWKIQLPPNLMNSIRREDSKRFIPGCLLLFTDNNFGDTFIGLISHPKDTKAMEEEANGIFTVLIKGDLPSVPWEAGHQFLTLECENYFEPYRCVMTALKQNAWLTQLPISQYLLNADFAGGIRPPKYLMGMEYLNVASGQMSTTDLTKWPPGEELGLDDAQFKAYQAALTQELVLIQGPPGTGKTYLGLRILETLMEKENMAHWRGKQGGPIIITCYTNHALDQMGEGILDLFTPEEEKDAPTPYHVTSPKIMRLGTGCQSPRLRPYTPGFDPAKKPKINRDTVDILLLTTTGAAIRIQTLMKLKSKIMIVEEAAEVFESHILACFTPFLEHLILLGDHQQLRPLTATRELSDHYQMNVSLFERMVAKNNFPRYQLEVQHRMRPVIRDLITGPHIYPVLRDHPSVHAYPPVRGMERSCFFVDHKESEAILGEDETSYSNPYEAVFLATLCQYLLKVGHPPESITVLGMYSSQVRMLEREIWGLRGIPRDLRIETVDSFQGEENEIILLSLVRSNRRGDIGFMKEDNRICVAMSRARQGFYMIGNMELLWHSSATWQVIYEKLRTYGNIGPGLVFFCDKHQMKMGVRNMAEFQRFLRIPCPVCANPQIKQMPAMPLPTTPMVRMEMPSSYLPDPVRRTTVRGPLLQTPDLEFAKQLQAKMAKGKAIKGKGKRK